MFKRFRIQNFRSIGDVNVELSPVTVLVGRSGSGKTNFIEAIRFLRDVLNPGRQMVQAYHSLLPAAITDAVMRFEVEFAVPGYGDPFVYELAFFPEGPAQPPAYESLRHGEEVLFRQGRVELNDGQPVLRAKKPSQWLVPPSLLPAPKPGPIAIGRLPGLEDVVVAYSALSTGIGVYAFPFSVLKSGNANAATGLLDDASNYLAVLRDLLTSIKDINLRRQIAAIMSRLNPTVQSVDIDSLQQPKSAIVGHRHGEKTLAMNLSWESDGFRRFYAHLLALYQLPSKQLLIFEEPENGIYPGALSVLAEEFRAAPVSGRGQVLLTTHSPRLLDHFEASDIRVVEIGDGLQTRIGPLAEEQRSAIQENLLSAGELLTVDPARMEAAAS